VVNLVEAEVVKNVRFSIDFSNYRFQAGLLPSRAAFKTGVEQLIKRGAFKDSSPKLTTTPTGLVLDLTIDERMVARYKRELGLVSKPYELLGVKSSFEVVS
jgi:hypothetical protein